MPRLCFEGVTRFELCNSRKITKYCKEKRRSAVPFVTGLRDGAFFIFCRKEIVMRKRNKKKETEPLQPPRVNYRALKRHEAPGRAREPPEKPVCTESLICRGCPYPGHGFVCWPENCMRKQMEKIQRGGKSDESQDLSDQS